MRRSRANLQTARKTLQSSNRNPHHNISLPAVPSTSEEATLSPRQNPSNARLSEAPLSNSAFVLPQRNPDTHTAHNVSGRHANEPSAPDTPTPNRRQFVSLPKNTKRAMASSSGANNSGGETRMEQMRRNSGWTQRFPQQRPLPPRVSWGSCREPEEGRGEHQERRRTIKVPSAGCSLSRQEQFAKELRTVLRTGVPLTRAVDFLDMDDPEVIAKSIMTEEEREMYNAWNSGEIPPEDNWESTVEGMERFENPRDAEEWEQHASVLNEIYGRNDLTKSNARVWWTKNAEWKPLTMAVRLMRQERLISELIACKEVLAQMEQHQSHVKKRTQLYATHFVRKYRDNIHNVMALLHDRIGRLEDENNMPSGSQPLVIRVPDDS